MLEVERDKLAKETDVAEKTKMDNNEEGKRSHIAALFGESVFYNKGQFQQDSREKDESFVEFGDDPCKK